MNPWLIKRTIDMQKWQRSMEYLGVLAYSGNEKGHRIELTMRSGEANLPLDGYTVRGYFYLGKPENPEAVMPVKGSASGNLATLDFPAEAYAVGQASVVVCAEKTGEQIPLYSGSYTVRNGSAKVLLDPSKTIPSLSALLGEIEDMRNVTADGRAQQKQMAEEFAGYQGEIDGIKADIAENYVKRVYGVNLFNPDNAVSGFLDGDLGAIIDSSSYKTTGFIQVKKGISYRCDPKIRKFLAFDANKNAIRSSVVGDAKDNYVYVPDQDGFIRASYYVSDAAKFIVYQGDAESTVPYEHFEWVIDPDISVVNSGNKDSLRSDLGITEIEKTVDALQDSIERIDAEKISRKVGKNLFNPT